MVFMSANGMTLSFEMNKTDVCIKFELIIALNDTWHKKHMYASDEMMNMKKKSLFFHSHLHKIIYNDHDTWILFISVIVYVHLASFDLFKSFRLKKHCKH